VHPDAAGSISADLCLTPFSARTGSPVTGHRSRLSLLLVLTLPLAGCSLLRRGLGLPPSLPDCPGRIVSTADMGGDFLLRQRLRVRGDGVDVGFELVTQKKGAELTMIGLTSFGAKAFALTQKGTDVRVDSFLGPAWPVPPRNVLRDLNRMSFLAVPGGPFPDGPVEVTLDGTRITERWRHGELLRRSFRRVDGDPGGTVTVDFAPRAESGAPGRTVRIRNDWCGYRATVFTAERRP
jgi:hypothetical protein